MNFYENKYLKYKYKYLHLRGGVNELSTDTFNALLSLNNPVSSSDIDLYLSIQTKKQEQSKIWEQQNKIWEQQKTEAIKQREDYKQKQYRPPFKRNIEDFIKYMGIPGWGKTNEKKITLPSNDINIDKKTIGRYIWDVDEKIMEHLKKYSQGDQYYYEDGNKIPSLKFMGIEGLHEDIKSEVQELIKLSYPTTSNEPIYPEEYPYNRLNLLQKNLSKGYYYDYSREIVNANSEASLELFKKIKTVKSVDLVKKLNALNINSQRTCDNAHKVQGNTILSKPYEPVLFEDLLIGKDESDEELTGKDNKQLIYTSTPYISKYFNNSKIIVSPFLQPYLSMGVLSYNSKTNKAITQCIFTHSTLVFPLRLILYLSLVSITYINLFENIKNNIYNYVGFFLVRLLNETENKIINEKCKLHYDNYDTVFPESRENYWVFFVFQKNKITLSKHSQYEFVNYRCNIVDRGTINEQKKVIYNEIQQLICMYANEQLHFYILLLKNKKMVNKTTTDSCKTFFQQYREFNQTPLQNDNKINDNKIPPELCLISNLHHTFIKLLNQYFILPYTVYNYDQKFSDPNYKHNEQHIFICKKQTILELYNNIILFKKSQIDLLYSYIVYLLSFSRISFDDIDEILVLNKDIKHYNEILKYYNIYIELLNIKINLIIHSTNGFPYDYIEIKSKELTYGLFPCYFDWSSNNELYDDIEDKLEIERHRLYKIINDTNKESIKLLISKLYIKERLCIKCGEMSSEKKSVFKVSTCIDKTCIQFLNDTYRDKYAYKMFMDETLQTEDNIETLNIDEKLI